MTLEEFIKECHKDIDDFEASWLDESDDAPKNFPMEMEPGDWWEQFVAFIECNAEEDT